MSLWRKLLLKLGILKQSESCIDLADQAVGLGVVRTVYDRKKHFNANSGHKWIPVQEDGELFWIRLTINKYNESKGVALRNPEDQPYELK